jgi:hypothetical protein
MVLKLNVTMNDKVTVRTCASMQKSARVCNRLFVAGAGIRDEKEDTHGTHSRRGDDAIIAAGADCLRKMMKCGRRLTFDAGFFAATNTPREHSPVRNNYANCFNASA